MTEDYSNPSYDAEYDFPPYEGRPSQVFLVATTPRSGSSLLAFLCRQTGALGFPLEYFTEINARIIRRRLSLRDGDLRAYAEALARIRSSSNGVFGFKLHHDELGSFRSVGGWGLPMMANVKVILLERQDKLSQAISLVMASQTNRWIDLPGYHMQGAPSPSYDRLAIAGAMRALEHQHLEWKTLLSNEKVETLPLSYESILENCPEAFRRICGFLSIPAVIPSLSTVELQSQNSQVNRDWKTRYLDGK